MSACDLLRPDLRAFNGYRSARSVTMPGDVWLNANEAAASNAIDTNGGLRRYPDPQPPALREALGSLYGVSAHQLLVGRGSDEAIDLLMRAFCRPGHDSVLVTPPVFGMYAVCAALHGVRVVEAPLHEDSADFNVDLRTVRAKALESGAKLVFLCSPGNPAGGTLSADTVLELARALRGRALLVLDEAYVDFADAPSLAPLAAERDNLVVLRTLSKAHALAGARIGCAIACADVVAAMRLCQAPYPVPAPCAELALQALAPAPLARTRQTLAATLDERERVRRRMTRLPGVVRVYPSQTNFLLARFSDASATFARLLAAGVVVRDVRDQPQLRDALRITIGTAACNTRLLDALE